MIKKVGPTQILPRHRASCHCGAVVLELDLPDGIVDPRRCNCSMCRRRGAIVATVAQDGIHIIQGHSQLKLYQFNTRTARHYFCGNCGIIPIISAAPTPPNMGTTWVVWKVSILLTWARFPPAMASIIPLIVT